MRRLIAGFLAIAGLLAMASLVVIDRASAQVPAAAEPAAGAAPETGADAAPAKGKKKRVARRSSGRQTTEQRVRAGVQKYAPEYQGYLPSGIK